VALLRRLHAAGLTQRQIAAQLGRTHDSVARKMRQLRLTKGGLRAADGTFAGDKPAHPQRAGLVTLPPLPSLADDGG
jgi:IS30 family transposase